MTQSIRYAYRNGSHVTAHIGTAAEWAAYAASEGLTEGVAPVPSPPTIDQRRAAAAMTRGEFCVVAFNTGVLATEADAEVASTGQFPAAFEQYIAGLAFAQRVAVREAWAVERNVRHDNPLLAIVSANFAGAGMANQEDKEAAGLALRDALFGIT